jgi:hypothetical protein
MRKKLGKKQYANEIAHRRYSTELSKHAVRNGSPIE